MAIAKMAGKRRRNRGFEISYIASNYSAGFHQIWRSWDSRNSRNEIKRTAIFVTFRRFGPITDLDATGTRRDPI